MILVNKETVARCALGLYVLCVFEIYCIQMRIYCIDSVVSLID